MILLFRAITGLARPSAKRYRTHARIYFTISRAGSKYLQKLRDMPSYSYITSPLLSNPTAITEILLVGKHKQDQSTQLNIQFEKSNPFAEQLRSGQFTVVVECHTPATGQPFDSGVALAQNIAQHVKRLQKVTALAVTDRLQGEERYDPARVADILGNAAEKPIVMHLSGKGSSQERVSDQISQAASSGIRNILAVTGDRSHKHPQPHTLNRSPRYEKGYMDSVAILRALAEAQPEFYPGAGVNPYKYNPADQYLQYYKMMRKINSGAEFIITNFGWDMKKLQELQWYLQMRDIGVPVLARIGLLTPTEIAALGDTAVPGVPVSKSFAALLQRESNVNATQSLAAQMQRLALQIVGCRHLGFSGVQLTAIRDAKTLDMILKRADQLAADLHTYADWVQAWNEHHGELNFAPSSNSYYIFTKLLDPEQQMYDPDNCRMTAHDFPAPRKADRLWAMTMGRLMSTTAPEFLRDLAIKISCRKCTSIPCDLSYSNSLCPKPCPKRLVYGACGGSQADGTCEFGLQICFFQRVLALASIHHDFDRLETPVK